MSFLQLFQPLYSIFQGKLLKETLWSFSAKGIVFVLYMVLNIVLARTLGPDRFGLFSFFLSVFTILQIISYFGINKSSRKFAAQYNHLPELSAVIRGSLRLRLLSSALTCVVVFILRVHIANLVDRTEFELFLLTAIPLLFFSGLYEYLNEFFQGLHTLKYNSYLSALEYGLKIPLVVVFVKIFGIIGVIYAFSIAILLACLVGLYFLYIRFYRKAGISELTVSREILMYSIPLFFTSLGFMSSTEVDTVMLGYLKDNVDVAIYTVAKQPVAKLSHISFAMALGVMPVFARFTSDRENLKRLFLRLLKLNTYIHVGVLVFIVCTAWFLIPLLYGQEYQEAVIPALLLLPYLLFVSYSIFLSFFLDYQGKASKRAINLTIGLVLNICFNLWLIPRYGASGAALATSASYLPYCVLNWLEVKKELYEQD